MAPEPRVLPLGRGRLLAGDGADPGVLVLSAGTVTREALAAVASARARGIKATLFDARFVKPLDEETIVGLCRRASAIVTVEENALAGGFGAAVLECLADAGLALPPVRRLGLPDAFVGHGAQEELLREVGLDADSIVAVVERLAEVGSPRRG
jgi:1-deoxy-D-xylulose-5-phosphate synthase